MNGIGVNNDLLIVGGRANAFIVSNICKNLYTNIYY